MKLEYYSPNFRGVLFEEVIEEKTDSGLFLPTKNMVLKSYSDMFENEKVSFDGKNSKLGRYVVVKVGNDCTSTMVGDIIYLSTGIRPEELQFDEGTYFQVIEQQIIGKYRKPLSIKMEDFDTPEPQLENASIPDAHGSQSETSRSSKL